MRLLASLHALGARACRPVLLAGLALAIAAQVFFVARFGDRRIDNEWSILAGNILEHGAMTYHVIDGERLPSAFMPPLYVGLVVGVAKALGVGANFAAPDSQRAVALALEMLQLGFTLLSGFGIFQLAKLATGHRGAALAATVVFLSMPLVLVQASQVSSVALYLMLGIYLLLATAHFARSRSLAHAAAAGALMSLLLVARGEAMLLLPLFVLVIFVGARDRRVVATTVFLAAAAPAPAVWTARNLSVFGRPAPLTVSFGYNLHRGHNPVATADGNEPDAAALRAHFAPLRATPAYELERDRVFRDLALAHVREHPGSAVTLAARKFVQLWLVDLDFTYPEYQVFQRQPLYIVNWLIIVGLSAIGLVALFRRRGEERLLFAGYLFITTGTHLLFFVLPRYRTHLLPVLAVLAGLGLLAIAEWMGRAAARARPGAVTSPPRP